MKKSKALFLDRDGVINHEKVGSYILKKEEFKFYDGVLEAIKKASDIFDYIILVTNQRGIGRGLMMEADLMEIHHFMNEQIKENGGNIDAIYYAAAVQDKDENRKPNIGMALQAKKEFPDIDFENSVMIGNNFSDMEFGKRMKMKTIFLHTTQDKINLPHELIDDQFESLKKWSESI